MGDLTIIFMIISFFVLYVIIETGVRRGIDSSVEIRKLKAELREVNSRLKRLENKNEEKGSQIDKKV